MAIETQIRVDGLDHLDKVLNEKIPLNLRRQVIRRTLHVAARPMVQAARGALRRLNGSGSLSLATRSWNVNRGVVSAFTKSGSVGTSGANARYVGAIHVGPKRDNTAALKRYYQYWRPGKAVPVGLAGYGIRHGHLVEFDTHYRDTGAVRTFGKDIYGAVNDNMAPRVISRFRDMFGRIIENTAERAGRSQKYTVRK